MLRPFCFAILWRVSLDPAASPSATWRSVESIGAAPSALHTHLRHAAADGHVVAIVAQDAGATLPQGPFVVDDQNPDAGFVCGREVPHPDDFAGARRRRRSGARRTIIRNGCPLYLVTPVHAES